jgi:hypothetical protein
MTTDIPYKEETQKKSSCFKKYMYYMLAPVLICVAIGSYLAVDMMGSNPTHDVLPQPTGEPTGTPTAEPTVESEYIIVMSEEPTIFTIKPSFRKSH